MDPGIPASIRVAFVIEGSRGDIQPYLAIARKLRFEKGYVVSIFTNSDQVSLCEALDIPAKGVFYSFSKAFGDPNIQKALAEGNAFGMAKGLRKIRMDHLASDLANLWPALDSFQPTLLLAGGISKSKTMLYSNLHTIPLVVVDLQVMLPVSDQGPVGLPTLPCGLNKLWWKLLLAGASSVISNMKAIATETLGVDPNGKFEMPLLQTMMQDLPSFPGPVCYGISQHVVPIHPEWPKDNLYFCGFFTMNQASQLELVGGSEATKTDKTETDPSDRGHLFGASSHSALVEFLARGSPPVYLGWGSMVCQSPQWMVALAIEALERVGQRGVLLGGWAGLQHEHVPDHLQEFCETNVIFVDSAAHEWLFPRCSCIVHHGGSGTTAASVRSGKPTIITPIQGDQFDFASSVQTIGCGIGLGHLSTLTPATLGDAIAKCLSADETISKTAASTGAKLRAEDGCERFCEVLETWLEADFASGKWHTKQEALMKKCREHHEAAQQKSCIVS